MRQQPLAGRREERHPALRDTGVEIRGPAVSFVERAFFEVWTAAGGQAPASEGGNIDPQPPAGDVPVRVIASTPTKAALFRMDRAHRERRSAIALAHRCVLRGLRAVRPGALRGGPGRRGRTLAGAERELSPLVAAFSRAGYRPLLEAGARVFEWNGLMIHAKTAVADGRWARVGSSNLNVASFVSNYEIDVALETRRPRARDGGDVYRRFRQRHRDRRRSRSGASYQRGANLNP